MRQIRCAAARTREIFLTRIGKLIDGAHQRLDFLRTGSRQPLPRTALERIDFIADPSERPQAERDLRPGSCRQNRPQQQQEYRQLCAELATRIVQRLVLGRELQQHLGPVAVRLDHALDQQQLLLEWTADEARAPVTALGDVRSRQTLIPQRARTQTAARCRDLPIHSAGRLREAQVTGLATEQRSALRPDRNVGGKLQSFAHEVRLHAPLDVTLEQQRHHEPGSRERDEYRDCRAEQQPHAQRARFHCVSPARQ